MIACGELDTAYDPNQAKDKERMRGCLFPTVQYTANNEVCPLSLGFLFSSYITLKVSLTTGPKGFLSKICFLVGSVFKIGFRVAVMFSLAT